MNRRLEIEQCMRGVALLDAAMAALAGFVPCDESGTKTYLRLAPFAL